MVGSLGSGGSDVVVENNIGTEKARLTPQHQHVKLVNGANSWNAVAGGTLPV